MAGHANRGPPRPFEPVTEDLLHKVARVCKTLGSGPYSVVAKGDGCRWLGVRDVNELVVVVFSGLSALVIEGVTGEGEVIWVSARTRDDPVQWPACGTPTARVHGFHGRVLADVAVDGGRIVVSVRVRCLVCPVLDCPRQMFRERVPGVVERYQGRTSRLADQLNSVVKGLAGRAGARLWRVLACVISRSTALRMLMRQVVTPPCVPRVLGVDAFALKRRHRYATVIIDAETGERIDVLPDRTAQSLTAWLREHPGAPSTSAATAPPPTPKRSAEPSPKRYRSASGGTSGPTCAAGSWPKSAPAPPALLRERPRTRQRRRCRRFHLSVPQRPRRGCQHTNQTDHETDARPSRVPSAA